MAKKQFATKDNLQTLVNELKTRVVLPQEGKGLSANDLTNELLARLNAAQSAEQVSAAVSQAVAGADHLRRTMVNSVDNINLTAADADKYIYLVKNGETYDEYMVVDGKLEKVGDWSVNMDGYVQDSDFQELTDEEITGLFASWN